MRVGLALTKQKELLEKLPVKLKVWGLKGGASACATLNELLAAASQKHPDMLLIDWQAGRSDELAIAIQKIRQLEGCRTTALVLVAPEITQHVLALATDYGAFRVLLAENLEESCPPAIKSLVEELAKPSSLRSQLTRLEQAREKGAIGEADRIAMDLGTQFPEDVRALVETTNYNLRHDNLVAAKDTMQKLKKSFPNDLRVMNLNARILMKEGNFKQALAELEKADILSPKNAGRLQAFGDVYRNRNNLEKARNFYNQALEIEPEAKDALTGIGHIELSEGDINSALEMFRNSTTEEELISIFNNAAVLSVREQNFNRADELYQAALGAAGTNQLKARVSFNQGLAFFKSEQISKATECFVRSYKFDPTFEKNRTALNALKQNVNPEMQREALSEDLPVQFVEDGDEFSSSALEMMASFGDEDDDDFEANEPIKPAQPAQPAQAAQPASPAQAAQKPKQQPTQNSGTGRIIQLGGKK